jgi:thiol-disulfide isomerase/thioredoxin
MRKPVSAVLWTAAVLFLIAVMVFVNLPKKVAAGGDSGKEGDIPDFSITCLDGTEFKLSEQRGKAVVINLWATWCIPCIDELPDFDRLSREYPDTVSVIAIHTAPVTDDVAEWVSGHGYDMLFAVDEEGRLSDILNPSSVLPQTIVMDGDGNVVYNSTGSLEYEELSNIVSGAVKP